MQPSEKARATASATPDNGEGAQDVARRYPSSSWLPDRILSQRSWMENYAGLGILAAIFVALAIGMPSRFLTSSNLIGVVNTQVVALIMTLGVLLPLSAGVFDISIGGVMTLAVIASTGLFAHTGGSMPVAAAILLTLVMGSLCGVFNAVFVVGMGIDPFIVTLGSGSLFVSLSELISGNQVVAAGIPQSFLSISRTKLDGIPLPVIYTVVLGALLWYFLDMTPGGRMLYATGGSRDTARLTGIPTNRLLYLCFIGSAVGASASGILFAAQIGSGQPDIGQAYLLPVYASAFLGSTMIKPGRFNVPGAIVATFILAFGINGLELLNSPAWIVDGFPGAALITAVVIAKQLGRSRIDRVAPVRQAKPSEGESGTSRQLTPDVLGGG